MVSLSLGGGDMVPTQKLRAHWQFVRCQPKGFTRHGLGHTVQFKQNVARPHRRDPMFGLALAFAHAGFWRTGSTDLSGKMRIHSLPLRFILRVRATRAASSCVLV